MTDQTKFNITVAVFCAAIITGCLLNAAAITQEWWIDPPPPEEECLATQAA